MVRRTRNVGLVAAVLMLAMTGMAMADEGALPVDGVASQSTGPTPKVFLQSEGIAFVGACIGVGVVVVGGAIGISRIGSSAVESMARQPEATKIFPAMIIAAAMIEGATLFAVPVCLLGIIKS